MNTKVSVTRCSGYEPTEVLKAVRKSVDLIGGIAEFIKPNSRVLVKPNLLLAKEPEFGITTHPEVVRAVILLLKEIGCHVLLGDAPSVWGNQIQNLDEVFRRTGMEEVCRQTGAKLVSFDKRRMRRNFPLTVWLDECDFLVNLPKLKTHEFTLMTAAIKNLFGLVSGTFKTELHKNYYQPRDFASMLVDILEETRPALTVVDAITSMEGDGPGSAGKLRQTDLIIAGRDCVAVDCVAGLIMGLEPQEVLTTKEAGSRGLGTAELGRIELLGENIAALNIPPFKLPTSSPLRQRIPRPIAELAKKLIRYYPVPVLDNCIRCAACVKACPTGAVTLEKKGIVFNYRKCIACFCCQEACPAAAIRVKRSMAAKLTGL